MDKYIDWVDDGDYLLAMRDGDMVRCPACNCPLEYHKTNKQLVHECPPGTRRTLEEFMAEHGLADRLGLGFAMLSGDPDTIYDPEKEEGDL